MVLQSDLTVNYHKFDPNAVDVETQQFNQKLMDMFTGPRWYEVGATEYRRRRARGETPVPPPVLLENAQICTIPSREAGRDIICRYFVPKNSSDKPVGVYLHFHGGCWTMQGKEYQDEMLNKLSQEVGLVVISVGYRLAPENPFPAGPEDCYDAAEWLVVNSEQKFGAGLVFCGGESAGGHLAAMVTFHLAISNPDFNFKALILNFGVFDLSITPSNYNFRKSNVLILDLDLMQHYYDVVLPGIPVEGRKDPSISPLYVNLAKLPRRLPPALFTCGTEDLLLDDSVFMAAKWQMAGGEGILKIYPGAPHGFILFAESAIPSTKQAMSDVITYMRDKLGGR